MSIRCHKTRKRLVGSALVMVLLSLGLGLGLHLWVRSWEQRWLDFKSHWEAKGESFAMADHLPSPVDDALNFAKHPWVAAVASGDPAVIARLGKMEPDDLSDYSTWYDSADGEKLMPMPGALARQVLAHYEPFAADFAALAEAAARPHCRIEMKCANGIADFPTWVGRLSPCGHALDAHAAAALAIGDEDSFTGQVVMLLEIGRHLRSSNILLCTVVGCRFEMNAYCLITHLAPTGVKTTANRNRLLSALDGRRPVGVELAEVLRFDRAWPLAVIDGMEAGATPLPAARFSSIAIFRRLFFARNRLALCEDSQRELFAPGGSPTSELTLDRLTRYDEIIVQRFKDPSVFEVFAAGQVYVSRNVACQIWAQEEKCQAARRALTGGN